MRKVLKIFAYVLVTLLLIIFGVVVFLLSPPGQNFVRQQAESFLEKKIGTDVVIGGLHYQLPKRIVLEDVLIHDLDQDTLLSLGELNVNIAMLELLNSKVVVKDLRLDDVVGNLKRKVGDSTYNFQYIVDAFVTEENKDKQEVKVEDTSSSALLFDIDILSLNRIRFKLDDLPGGIYFSANLGSLNTRVKNFDLNTNTYQVKNLDIDKLDMVLAQGLSLLPASEDEDTGSSDLIVGADIINLNGINFYMNDVTSPMKMDIRLQKALLKSKPLQLSKEFIDIEDLMLQGAYVNITQEKPTALSKRVAAINAQKPIDTSSSNWKVVANKAVLKNTQFILDDQLSPHQVYGMDYAHLNAKDINFEAKDIYYSPDTILARINQLSLKEKSGFHLAALRANLIYHQHGAELKNLFLQTNRSLIQNYLSIKYPSISALSTNPELAYIKTDIHNSIVGVQDILIFAPDLRHQDVFKKYPTAQAKFNLIANGYMNHINIQDLYLAGLGDVTLKASGLLTGLPDPNKLKYQLQLSQVSAGKGFIESFIPKESLSSIRIPNKVNITGSLNGSTYEYRPNLKIATTDGNATIKGVVNIAKGTDKEFYDLNVNTQQLNLGRILKQDSTLGKVSANLYVKGTGFDPQKMVATVNGKIHSAQYNGYNYSLIDLNAKANKGLIDGQVVSLDPNATLDLASTIDLRGEKTKLSGRLYLDSIDVQKLGFYDKELRIRGKIYSDFKDLNMEYPDGIVTMDHPIVIHDGTKFVLDSLYLTSKPENGNQNIELYADVLMAKISGFLPLNRAGDVIMERISRYYKATTGDTIAATEVKEPLPENFDLTMHAILYDQPLLYSLIPSLKSIDTASLYASFTPYMMSVTGYAPRIIVGENRVRDLQITATGADSALRYNVVVDKLNTSFVDLYGSTISGQVKNNVLTTNINLRDSKKEERFVISGMLYSEEDGNQTFALGDQLMLDYKNWAVNQPNRIVFGSNGFFAENFGFSNTGQSINITSSPLAPNAPLEASFNNFMLANIFGIANQDTNLVDGALNGKVSVQQFSPLMQMDANLKINHLSVFGDTIGLLSALAKTVDGNTYNANLGITEQGNDLQLNGDYHLEPVNGNNLDFKLDLNNISLKSIQGLAFGQIKNSTGGIKGKLDITGLTTEPVIVGEIKTDQLATQPVMLGTTLSLPDEAIQFSRGKIAFKDFNVYDENKKYLRVAGNLQTKDYSKYDLNLRLRATEWMPMNSTSRDDENYFGKLILSTNMNIKGTSDAPNIDGSLTVHDSTRLTIALPESKQQLQSHDGIVEFVDFDDPFGKNMRALDDTTETLKLGLGSIINANINVEKNATFNIIMDQGTGDLLSVKGLASLNTVINPDGTLGLTGSYELQGGSYELNYNLIKRKFNIQPGSTLTFLGEPTEAEVDIKAVYEANVAPIDLLQNQLPESDLVFYRQRLPFDVVLGIKGRMLKPEINFDVQLPEEKAVRAASGVSETVQAKLANLRNDASEMNKQVFAVLLLNRFVGENPFAGGSGLNVEYAIRQSVSRFLSEQLNKVADQLLKGVEFNMDLTTSEDYTTGEKRNRTDLNLAASKRLLNDRLNVTIGNDFTLEGQNPNRTNSVIPGNLQLDYALTEDGRYAVRAYRKNRDLGVIEGFVVETGVKFRFNVDYDKFKYAFESIKKRQERMAKENPPVRQRNNQQRNTENSGSSGSKTSQ